MSSYHTSAADFELVTDWYLVTSKNESILMKNESTTDDVFVTSFTDEWVLLENDNDDDDVNNEELQHYQLRRMYVSKYVI